MEPSATDVIESTFSEHGFEALVSEDVSDPHSRRFSVQITEELNGVAPISINGVDQNESECSMSFTSCNVGFKITHRELEKSDSPAKIVEEYASMAAQEIDARYTERLSWADSCVLINWWNYPDVTCQRCGADVSMSDLRNLSRPVSRAEMSTPRPQRASINGLDDVSIKFALLAMLRRECEWDCPSNRNL